ncbi:MAG: type II secretion system F family protein [Deltaproteobacteria bacterium]|nr:type II secretion system F family protein [Deltaproteobacteria bacterium]MCL5277967.1 type II secretion system F family protein [Deltaproteobacteria bacterium]
MAVFRWEGIKKTGETVKGSTDAQNENAVIAILRQQDIRPITIKEKKASLDLANLSIFKEKVTGKDLSVFTRQFATMIDSGLPLVQCLDILGAQQPNKTFQKTIKDIKASIEGGSTFAAALKKHPETFDSLYTNLVSAGEVGGMLDTILARLATYIEKAEKLKGRVKGAMVYPIVVLSVAAGAVAILLLFVIPIFAKMFADVGAALPAPTQFVMDLSNFLKHYILYLIIGIGAVVYAIRRYYKTSSGQFVIDGLLLKTPVFGEIIRKNAVARFTRTLSTMISSGVPIMDGLEIVARTSGNVIIENAIMKARESIAAGKTISEPLAQTKVFPSMVVQMISVGEATGNMDAMLSKIADFYDEEVDTAVAAMTSLIEPLLIVFLGVVIGGLVVAMYLPIFKIASTIK